MANKIGRSGASAVGPLAEGGAASCTASPPKPSVPNAWEPIEYEEGYPIDEGFGHFCRQEPPLDFHRAAHWLLAELPRACEHMCCWCKVSDATEEYGKRPVKLIEFSTSGWSGAESIIGLIERRFDMAHFMKSWKRGGHFVFEIPTHFLSRESSYDEGPVAKPCAQKDGQ